MDLLSDERILGLIAERKPIPPQLVPLGLLNERSQHYRKDFRFKAPSGNEFTVFIRKSMINPFNFSVILGYQLPDLYTIFRLRRYNGRSHTHTNVLEHRTFYDFHVHTATERYQRAGFTEDFFAEPTNRYHDLKSAIDSLLNECGFRSPLEEAPLFTGRPD